MARSPLSYPAFRLLWVAGIVTFVGSFVQNVAEAWVMMDLSKSPLPVAMLATTFTGASLLMMLPGGVLADRYDRRKVAMVSQAVQGLAALGMGVLAWTGHITPFALMGGVALLGLGMALGAPAWVSMVPELVPRELIAEAMALNAVAYNLARAVGPAIGGLVLARFGATTSFFLNALSFAVVAIALLMYRNAAGDAPATPAAQPVASGFAEPVRIFLSDANVRAPFFCMWGFTLGAGIFYALTPAFGRDTLGATPFAYGLMIGAMGVGAVIGATILKRLRARVTPRVLITGTMLVFAFSVAMVSRAKSIPAAMAVLVPAGVGWLGSFSSLAALVQIWAPDRARARTMALYQVTHLATWAIAATAGGLIADRYGVRAAIATGAVLCAGAAAITWKIRLPGTFTRGAGVVLSRSAAATAPGGSATQPGRL